ncbi:MAG: hypothetical protein QXZ43_04735 [Candidatus Aenigmatarchaeota archaeon]
MKEKIIQLIKRNPGIVIFPVLFVLLVSPYYVLPEKQSKTYECCVDYISYPVLKTIHFSFLKIFVGFSNEEIKMMKQGWDQIHKLYRENYWKSQGYFCPLEKIF